MTLDELNTKMSEMFLSSQLDQINWNTLTDTDKQAALINANAEFNRLQWIGKKANPDQEDAFPRLVYDKIVETPDTVKMGLCRYIFDYIRIETSDAMEDIRSGIQSYKIGPISETYNADNIEKYRVNYKKYIVDWIYRGVR